MTLHAYFTFDRAGQGLFYHGEILCGDQSFSVVYDCGTSNQIKGAKENLSEVVDQYHREQQKQTIGLLAISHFDFDHVSHIPELLQKCKVDTVMLPHISKELRVVFWAKCAFDAYGSDYESGFIEQQEQDRDLIELFRNPVGYFREKGAKQIIGVSGDNDGNVPSNEEPIFPFEPKESEYEDSDRSHLRYVGGGQQVPQKDQKYVVYEGSPTYRFEAKYYSWLFRPLNIQDKLPQAFYDDVKSILRQYSSWQDLLSDFSKIKELRQLYDLYIGRGRRNSHSLLLRHEPEQHRCLMSNCCKNRRCRRYQCLEWLWTCKKFGPWDNSATVLLGDLELDGKARAALKRYKFLCDKTGVVLIPHHGANSDDLMWLDEEIMQNDNCASLVVSYGTKNRHKNKDGHPHPRFIYDGKIAEVESTVFFSNEKIEYRYSVYLCD